MAGPANLAGQAITAGIDCGSAACKGVLMRGGAIIAKAVRPTGWNPRETAEGLLRELLLQGGLAGEAAASSGEPLPLPSPDKEALEQAGITVVATGYGRVAIPFAARTVTEITCHSRGAEYLLPGVGTVIDIGGQDSKAISLHNGKVLAFQMNDKCAAGTGRFLEMSAARMGVTLAELDGLLQSGESCRLSSMCAVFADSEIVSLLAAGKSRQEVAGGVIDAVAGRAAALAARVEVRPPLLLTGGLGELEGLRKALAAQLSCRVETSPLSRFAGAIGAALS